MNFFGQKIDKIKRHVYFQFLLNIIFKIKIWSPKIEFELEKSIIDFIAVNKKFWKKKKFNKNKSILVEGHLTNYGINYLYRTALVALAIQEVKNLNIRIIYPGFNYQWKLSNDIYASFGIDDFLYIRNQLFFYGLINKIKCFYRISYFRKQIKIPQDIIELKFDDIAVGDLIYDDILKKFKLCTISEINNKMFQSINEAYKFYLDYKYLFKNNQYSYYVSTHSAYSEYGILCRVALKYQTIVIETTDIHSSIFKTITPENLPTYHQGIINLLSIYSKLGNFTTTKRSDAKNGLIKRMNAEFQQIDIQKAYRGKIYNRKELNQYLVADDSNKNVFIFAHIFSDSPHTSSEMLYSDYYVWLNETIKIISKISDVNWIIKSHPATSLYNEDGIIEKIINNYNATSLYLCPADLNTKSIIECADAIVTVHGTAGLEFSCFGIPVILAGKPFYSSFGFTIEPKSVYDYELILNNLKNIEKLNDMQINKALEILYFWNTSFEWNNSVITMDILQDIWGSERERNIVNAYKKITENIKSINPKDLKIWSLTKKLISY